MTSSAKSTPVGLAGRSRLPNRAASPQKTGLTNAPTTSEFMTQPIFSRLHVSRSFLVPKLRRVVEFFTSQGITMAGNLLYGFLCMRILPIPEYAKYIVVFGFLGTLSILTDISFSGTLIPLIGEHVDNRHLIADYVASLRQLARWMYFVVAPCALVAFPILVRRQHWDPETVAAMTAALLVAGWCARVSGIYGAVLIVRRDRQYWYGVQMASSLGTLLLLLAFWYLHWLIALTAILINLAGMIYVSAAYFWRSRHLLGMKGISSSEKRKNIVHLAMPTIPNSIFYAFQGQITLIIITIFGHTTAIAGVGALSKLGQVFALLAPMGTILIGPYFAKLSAAQLKRHYLATLLLLGVFAGLVVASAACFPAMFLWILGPKYSNLQTEVVLMLAASTIAFVVDILYLIHSSRRFVYWWNSVASTIITIATEVLFIWKFDLSTVRGVLILNLTTALGGLAVNVATGVYGFLRGPRERKSLVSLGEEHDYA